MYTPAKIQELLQQLREEAFLMMLFLKSVARVEVLEWPADSAEPVLMFSCHISNMDKSVAAQRALFLTSSSTTAGKNGDGKILSSYMLEMQALTSAAAAGAGYGDAGSSCTKCYLIVQHKAGGEAAQLAEQLSQQFAVPLVPWGAVAAEITDASGSSSSSSTQLAADPASGQAPDSTAGTTTAAGKAAAAAASAGSTISSAQASGRAFCFLPLPAKTGLPVHINAFFELSSNRRDIW